MNKTIIININGTVFHIEENAYEILKQYMTGIKRHFFDSEDSLEITTDIENRVAELFTEILANESRQAIIDQDVTNVISQMGAVEDFEGAAAAAGQPGNYVYNSEATTRRLFRDPDSHLVAGVCSGIANYFDTQAIWIRLVFAISILFAGTGLFLYLVLWIVLPKAITRADRMAMKGEKLDLQGFKKNFEEEVSSVRERLADVHHEAKPFIYRLRDFIGEFFSFLGKALGGGAKLIIKLIGIAFLVSFFAAALGLIVVFVLVVGFGHHELVHIFPFSVIGNRYDSYLYVATFFVILLPLLALILILLRLIFNTQAVSRSLGSTMAILWIGAICALVFYAAKITEEYRDYASFTQTINIKPSSNNIYKLVLNDTKFFTAEDSARLDIQSKFNGLVVTDSEDNDTEPNNVSLVIEKSDVSTPTLYERYSAKGHNYETALMNARNTKYIFSQQDSVLKFDYKLHRLGNGSWHNEEIVVVLKVPVNAVIKIDQSLGRYTSMDEYNCRQLNKTPDAPFTNFIMTANGAECKVDTLLTDTTKLLDPDTIKPRLKPRHHIRK